MHVLEVTIFGISCMPQDCIMYYGIHNIILFELLPNKEKFTFHFVTSLIFVAEKDG